MARFRVRWLIVALLGLAFLSGCVPAGDGGAEGDTNTLSVVVVMALIFGMFYFLAIRPQRRRQKQQQQLMQELKKGDRVITVGGIYGEIVSTDEDSLVLKVESGNTLRVAKGSIHHKIVPG